MNVLKRYTMDRSGRASAMDDVGGPRMGGGMSGGEPILMGYQQSGEPNALMPQQQAPQVEQDSSDIDSQITHSLMTRAETREQAEAMLKEFAQSSGDAGLGAVDRVAKQLGLRVPWHRDFSMPPAQSPNALMGRSGRPMPFQRGGYE